MPLLIKYPLQWQKYKLRLGFEEIGNSGRTSFILTTSFITQDQMIKIRSCLIRQKVAHNMKWEFFCCLKLNLNRKMIRSPQNIKLQPSCKSVTWRKATVTSSANYIISVVHGWYNCKGVMCTGFGIENQLCLSPPSMTWPLAASVSSSVK